MRNLLEDGFEVGVYGLDHDSRDFESLRTFCERLPPTQISRDGGMPLDARLSEHKAAERRELGPTELPLGVLLCRR